MFQGAYSLRRLCLGSFRNPHTASHHNIAYDTRLRNTNYAIYPGASNDTYIYEQSAFSPSDIFSNSEYDALSTTTFSPAMSTDSTLTLISPTPTSEHFLEERGRRPPTPAGPSNYPVHGSMAPQAPAMSRTTSNHRARESSADAPTDRRSRITSLQGHSALPIRVPLSSASLNELTKVNSSNGYMGPLPSHVPEYDPSTISEFEVEQRDRIAKINAEYNAASSSSSSSYYSNNNAAVTIESNARRVSTSPPNQHPPDTFTRVTSSQPLHPNLHFPTKPDDFNHAFNPNPSPSIFSTKDGSPPLVERVPSRAQFQPTNSQPGQFLPAQAQDAWNHDEVYDSDQSQVPSYRPPPQVTSNHSGSTSLPRSTQTTYTTSQETTNLNEYRPLPVPPPEAPRQRSTAERRPSVSDPRPDVNGLKGTSDARYRGQTAREHSYDNSELRRDVSNSPPRRSALPSSRELQSRAAMASEMRRDTRTPALRESNDYRAAPPTLRDAYVADAQKPPVENRPKLPHPTDPRDMYTQPPLTSSPTELRLSPSESHPQPATFVTPTDTERSSDRIRGRSTSFSNSTRPTLPPMSGLSQQVSSSQQYQAPNIAMPDPRRFSEQDKNVRTSPPSRMQEASVYNSDYEEPERRSDVRGLSPQAVYNSQPTAPNFNRDTHSSQRQSLPIGQPSSKSNDRTPSYPPRNSPPEVPSSRSRPSYVEAPGLPTRGAAPYDNLSMPVKEGSIGGYSSSSSSSEPVRGPPEQPTQRRYSDGDQNAPARPVSSSGRNSAPLVRSVRWTENLICPSPVFASQRRKGWFNRRG